MNLSFLPCFLSASRLNLRSSATFLFGAAFWVSVGATAFSQISYTSPEAVYHEDFNALDGSFAGDALKPWTDNATIPGWYATEPGYIAQGNPAWTSRMYNLRTDGSSIDMCLGSVPGTASGDISKAVRLRNETGVVLGYLSVEYIGEQWRNSGNDIASELKVSYRLGGEELTGGDWIDWDNLTFTALHTGGGDPVNLPGKAAANRATRGDLTVNGFAWQPGQDLWIRWTHPNHSGTNHALGIDQVSISAGETFPTPGTRGGWFWAQSGSGHPWGTQAVVGSPQREDDFLAILRGWNLGRIYGSYGASRYVDEPETIAAWNRRLYFNGIESWQLFAETNWVYSSHRDGMRQKLQNEVIAFNESRPGSDRFHGVHFDVEPHILSAWSDGSSADKRALIEGLVEMFEEARLYLDQNGAADLPIYGAFPHWYSNLGGQIGWDSEADRNAWFDRLGAAIDGMVIMTFENPSASSILSSVEWEMANFAGEVILSLRVQGYEWQNFQEMQAVMLELEAATGRGIDIQPLHRLAEWEAWRIRPTFDDWRAAYFTSAELGDSAISGSAGTPAGDGVANFYKYAFGYGPFDAVGAVQEFVLVTVGENGGTERFPALQFSRLGQPRDLVYEVESSADLVTWEAGPGGSPVSVAPTRFGTETAFYLDGIPVSEENRRFFRVKADRIVPIIQYTQNFNTLSGAFSGGAAHPWVDDQTLPGWFASLTQYYATANPVVTSRLYNLRASESTNQTLGSVPGGASGDVHVGVRIVNTDSETIRSFSLGYVGEQWRNSGNVVESQISVSYRKGGTGLTGGDWIALPGLTFTSPQTGGAAANLDGKGASSRRILHGNVAGLEINPGESLWIRWSHANHSGDNHALAIEDVEFSAFAVPEVP